MEKLFQRDKYSDVSLVAEGLRFPAHRVILAAVSPVFRDLLAQTAAPDDEQLIVNLDDLNADIVEEMLTYLYSGKTPNLKSLASQLLVAAHKYQVVAQVRL